jgi:hypothetical protein
MADLRLFVECTTKAVFDSHLAAGDITNNHIVFIQGTNQLWHNGVYYGLSAADAAKLAEVYARKEFGKISDGTEVSGELVVYSATKAEDTLVIKASSETGEVMNVTASANGFQIKLVAAEGTDNGTIKLNGNAVAVHGLGSAAYTDSTAYDAAGDAADAEAAAKGYADNITVNGQSQTSQAITIDGGDIDLTGYTKASAKSAVAATDTVNAGIGKLEYRLDNLDLGDATSASKDAFLTSTAFTGTPTAPTAAVNTATDQIATTEFVVNEIDDKIVAIQAMQFKGVADSASDLDADAQPGWTYRAGTAFTLGQQNVEVGDMIICIAAATTEPDADPQWSVVQNNIDGAVVGPNSSTSGHIATFNGATGKVIQDSGFTIATSVPANAVFTDTTYEVFDDTTDGLVPAASGTGDANKFLKGDGTWADPANTEYVFTSGTTGDFTVTAGSAAPQTVSIGKPATAGTADSVAHDLSITLGASGTAQTFDGSADLSVTVTPSAIGAADAVHTHTSDEVTIGTGYSKPQTVTAIQTSDTVQAAIGKLEAMFDWVVYNAVVPEP